MSPTLTCEVSDDGIARDVDPSSPMPTCAFTWTGLTGREPGEVDVRLPTPSL